MDIAGARWFAGKGRGGRVRGAQPLGWYQPPGAHEPGVRSEILRIDYPDGVPEYYHTLDSYRRAPVSGVPAEPAADPSLGYRRDATRDPEAMAVLLQALSHATEDLGPEPGCWRVVLRHPELLAGAGPARLIAGEQSNSTILFGDSLAMKLFRRLEPGRSLDVARHEMLAQAGNTDVDALVGWVSARLGGSTTPFETDLMMITAQVPAARDGWELACEAAAEGRELSGQLAELGRALARIHQALTQAEPTHTLPREELITRVGGRIDAAAAVVPQVATHREALMRILTRITTPDITTQAIHGDFHLGQTLWGSRGWTIIDFEGEPLTPRTQRQAPDSPWRDVAGIMRSLDYAGAATGRPDDPDVRTWVARAGRAFLAGYCHGQLSFEQRVLLDAYLVDKVCYEVVYETRERPAWATIPLHALTVMAQAEPGTDSR